MATEPSEQTTPDIPAPQSVDDLNRLMHRLGAVDRRITAREDKGNDQKARVDRVTEEATAPMKSEREALVATIQAYAIANRDELTNNGEDKTVEMRHGILKWYREGKGTLEVPDEEAAIAALKKKRGGRAYVRVKESLKRDELKTVPRLVAAIGARIVYKETLTILTKPTAAQKKRKKNPFKRVFILN